MNLIAFVNKAEKKRVFVVEFDEQELNTIEMTPQEVRAAASATRVSERLFCMAVMAKKVEEVEERNKAKIKTIIFTGGDKGSEGKQGLNPRGAKDPEKGTE